MAIKSGKKGLFMTILILILFLLILGELLTFALLNVNYNTLDQSLALGSSSINYGKGLSASANLFAAASLSQAIKTLATYELNASMRKGNLISNTTQYLGNLIVSGTLPNVAANTLAANFLKSQMNNLTLASYNLSLTNSLNLGALVLSVNQSRPQIYQKDPYSLSISYVENIALNSSGGRFRYQIPVNATISLNNTPDLFYYQQGIPRLVRFGNQANLTNLIGGINATNGNFLSIAYGPVYNVPTGSGGLTCASLSTMISANVPAFSFAPYNQMLILITPNAIGITGSGAANCASQYGGLITYSINSLSSPPTIPWLTYASSTNLLGNVLKNGQQALILGNTLSTYNIRGLAAAANGGYYFASPFTPSYLDRAQGSIAKQNPNGIFTLSNLNVQTASFNGVSSYIQAANSLSLNLLGGWTLSAWVNLNSLGTSQSVLEKYDWVPSLSIGGYILRVGSDNKVYTYVINGQTSQPAISSNTLLAHTWYNIVSTFDNNGLLQVYINGSLSGSNTISINSMPSSTTLKIGARGNDLGTPFNGMIADAQVYNKSLTPLQVAQLYQAGISGMPPTNSGLSGWWPLNGNPNDYSGQSNNGVPTNIIYSLPSNYVRDLILSTTIPTSLSPIPGLLNCNNNSQCSDSTLPHSYLGYMPLGNKQNQLQVATFNSYGLISVANGLTLSPTGGITIAGWVYWPVSAVKEMFVKNNNANTAPGAYEMFQNGQSLSLRLYVAASPTTVTSTNTLTLNAWHFVTGTWDGTTMKVYIDSVQDSQTAALAGPIDTTSGQLSYGAYANLLFPYIGSLSNFQLYGNALSANQIKQLYAEGIQGVPLQSTTNTLLAWWPLNGNANEYSGNSENGLNSNVIYSPFAGTYNSPGLSTISSYANEWQAIGLPRSGG